MTHAPHIIRAAQWLDEGKSVPGQNIFSRVLPTLKSRFGLTDADAAEAILLAGNYFLVRSAFA
ncbi:hypothetical protein QO004_000483 [Rhizobium mesoamericanum]|uniref:hypothetical protein n=1 Tax=Rhizobium mesoamericanum TaxID=1079800 RepID=UPI00277DBC16|nr:hypothetical protein [Rhizobium mesoamericanum]MDQ0558708.1 hypothetical protein [Rhizobium mesoamericanum]